MFAVLALLCTQCALVSGVGRVGRDVAPTLQAVDVTIDDPCTSGKKSYDLDADERTYRVTDGYDSSNQLKHHSCYWDFTAPLGWHVNIRMELDASLYPGVGQDGVANGHPLDYIGFNATHPEESVCLDKLMIWDGKDVGDVGGSVKDPFVGTWCSIQQNHLSFTSTGDALAFAYRTYNTQHQSEVGTSWGFSVVVTMVETIPVDEPCFYDIELGNHDAATITLSNHNDETWFTNVEMDAATAAGEGFGPSQQFVIPGWHDAAGQGYARGLYCRWFIRRAPHRTVDPKTMRVEWEMFELGAGAARYSTRNNPVMWEGNEFNKSSDYDNAYYEQETNKYWANTYYYVNKEDGTHDGDGNSPGGKSDHCGHDFVRISNSSLPLQKATDEDYYAPHGEPNSAAATFNNPAGYDRLIHNAVKDDRVYCTSVDKGTHSHESTEPYDYDHYGSLLRVFFHGARKWQGRGDGDGFKVKITALGNEGFQTTKIVGPFPGAIDVESSAPDQTGDVEYTTRRTCVRNVVVPLAVSADPIMLSEWDDENSDVVDTYECWWSLTAPVGHHIEMTFNELVFNEGLSESYFYASTVNVDCEGMVQVWDGPSNDTSPYMGGFCIRNGPDLTIASWGRHMFIRYTTDIFNGQRNTKGFSASVVAVPGRTKKGCTFDIELGDGEQLEIQSGIHRNYTWYTNLDRSGSLWPISTRGYAWQVNEYDYAASMYCRWHIKRAPHDTGSELMNLHWAEFALPRGENGASMEDIYGAEALPHNGDHDCTDDYVRLSWAPPFSADDEFYCGHPDQDTAAGLPHVPTDENHTSHDLYLWWFSDHDLNLNKYQLGAHGSGALPAGMDGFGWKLIVTSLNDGYDDTTINSDATSQGDATPCDNVTYPNCAKGMPGIPEVDDDDDDDMDPNAIIIGVSLGVTAAVAFLAVAASKAGFTLPALARGAVRFEQEERERERVRLV